MATLNPPFYNTNMLSLATKIVGAMYVPVPEGLYSEKVSFTIKSCLTPDAEAHPDIVEVSSLLSDVMMKYLDVLSTSHLMLEKKLDWERRRTQQYFMEADLNAVTYHHQLSILSQKNYEKLSLRSSSNGAASCKGEFSENTDLPVDSCQSACGKYEEGTYEEILIEDHRTIEKGMFSELDDELDILDNSSSSSLNNLKESSIAYESENTTSLPCTVSGETDSAVKYRALVNTLINWQNSKSNVLPPALQCNLKRRIIERFKKSLFNQQSNPCNLKSEMKKTPMEEVLEESDYYSFSSNRCLYYPKGTKNYSAEEENM